MSANARCKFRVTAVTDFGHSRTVKLDTVYDTTIPEDQAFTKATPYGAIEVNIANPAVYDLFKPGAQVYVDISPVEG